jgi:hypothetical protein
VGVFTTIRRRSALDDAGDTIAINPATYTEQVTTNASRTTMSTGPDVVIQAPSPLTPDLDEASVVEIGGGATVNIDTLTAIEQGDPKAAERLLPLVYEGLRGLTSTRSSTSHLN